VAAGSAHVDKQQVADPGQTRPGGWLNQPKYNN
jgi:hypothetical protein